MIYEKNQRFSIELACLISVPLVLILDVGTKLQPDL